MHELSLAGSILRLVEQAQERERFERVARLGLEVGALSGVEVEALRFALQAIAANTCLAGAELQFDEPAAQGQCLGCGRDAAIRSRLDLCPQCGGVQWRVQSGTGLRLLDLRVV